LIRAHVINLDLKRVILAILRPNAVLGTSFPAGLRRRGYKGLDSVAAPAARFTPAILCGVNRGRSIVADSDPSIVAAKKASVLADCLPRPWADWSGFFPICAANRASGRGDGKALWD